MGGQKSADSKSNPFKIYPRVTFGDPRMYAQ